MQREDNNSSEEQKVGEWLDLRVGRNPGTKVFSCNFCRRKFYSSQALGGHQNAHRRERSLLGHIYQSHNMMMMMMPRSLVVQPHSHIHKPPGRSMFSEPTSTSGQVFHPFSLEQGPDFMWAGSSQSEPDHNSDILDLNLKL